MLLPERKNECLWCGHRLIDSEPEPWRTCVKRSEEHIIPKSAYGRIVTYELCNTCNSEFSKVCDHALVSDARFVRAAGKAGIGLEKFLMRFDGTQQTESGCAVKVCYREGNPKIQPQLRPSTNLFMPLDDWTKRRNEIRGSLIAKVRKKSLPLNDHEIEAKVDALLQQVVENPLGTHYCNTLREGFRLDATRGPITVTRDQIPWETEWCLAKIVFELSCLAWPHDYQIYGHPVIQQFRNFLEKRTHNPTAGSGIGIFQFVELQATPAPQHTVSCTFTPTHVEWHLTFFGTAQWTWEADLAPMRPPPSNEFNLLLTNPIAGAAATIAVDPVSNSAPE